MTMTGVCPDSWWATCLDLKSRLVTVKFANLPIYLTSDKHELSSDPTTTKDTDTHVSSTLQVPTMAPTGAPTTEPTTEPTGAPTQQPTSVSYSSPCLRIRLAWGRRRFLEAAKAAL
jgi:hypothetical protein